MHKQPFYGDYPSGIEPIFTSYNAENWAFWAAKIAKFA
jgi:hypothetical protein